MDSSYASFKSDRGNKLTLFAGILIALLIPVIAWVIDIFSSGQMFTIDNIASIHVQNPVHWFLDAIPVITAFLLAYFLKKEKRRLKALEDEISKKDESIAQNASFAKEIGEGNYEAELNVDETEDTLGRSLMLMRDNLKANKEREDEENWIARGRDLV